MSLKTTTGAGAGDSRRFIDSARQRALALGHNYIGSEHIFLVLLESDEPVLRKALYSVGGDVHALAHRTLSAMTTASHLPPQQLPFTPRAKHVLELAVEEANRLDAGSIGPEHLLLGLLAEGEGIAAKALGGVCTLEQLRVAVASARRE
jgi:ATP-dependent Clp protease ATP-binding subunit ClpC